MSNEFDVVIVGGGPGGSTTGTLLKKYSPELRVLILERERFPREHIGESQLPPIGKILNEMGVWDKVERAGFIIKLGASYTWGKTAEPWVFGFIPDDEVRDDPRPAKYGGWRSKVALQVDRAVYDKILLDHAREMGCEVREQTSVVKVLHADDEITALELSSGETVRARWFVDASGNAAVLRRALGVQVDAPTLLQNVAFWDYWQKPGMNKPLLERGIIRIRIRSLPYGWIWYIALSDDRTSVGLVCPAEYFKECGKEAEELYRDALSRPADIQDALKDASCDGHVRRTTDWSYVADRVYGKNWFLCGEALGFADPILSAGMTLTHTCARHLAYTILELSRNEIDRDWLLREYNETQRRRVIQHMKFAEYWYTGNGFFREIEKNCAAIAAKSGLVLSPSEAFRWLSHGGIDDEIGQAVVGGLSLAGIKGVQWRLSHNKEEEIRFNIDGKNRFKLKLDGATEEFAAELADGRVKRVRALSRDGDRLPLTGAYGVVFEALEKGSSAQEIFRYVQEIGVSQFGKEGASHLFKEAVMCLEMMVARKWVTANYRHGEPSVSMKSPLEGEIIYTESLLSERRKTGAAQRKK